MGKREEQREVRRANKIRIVKFISRMGAVSKSEIASSLRLSMPTALQHVKELMEDGYLVENGEYGSTGGRKAKMLSLNETMAFAAGIDIEPNHIGFVLVNMRMEMIQRAKIRIPFSRDFAYYESMGKWLHAFLEQSGVDRKRVAGVGISVPGTVKREENRMVYSPVLQAENVSFNQFGEWIGYPCQVENGVCGEAYEELFGEEEEAVYLSLNDVAEGAVYRRGRDADGLGSQVRASWIGHMQVGNGGLLCYCGRRGCLNSLCSAKALSGENGKLDVFFQKVHRKEAGYKQRLEKYLDCLAVAVTNVRMAFGCRIVLGGAVGGYLGDFRKDLDRRVAEVDRMDSDTSFLQIGKCQADASACGAAMGMVERVFEEI